MRIPSHENNLRVESLNNPDEGIVISENPSSGSSMELRQTTSSQAFGVISEGRFRDHAPGSPTFVGDEDMVRTMRRRMEVGRNVDPPSGDGWSVAPPQGE